VPEIASPYYLRFASHATASTARNTSTELASWPPATGAVRVRVAQLALTLAVKYIQQLVSSVHDDVEVI